jgi:hypothetical protein
MVPGVAFGIAGHARRPDEVLHGARGKTSR